MTAPQRGVVDLDAARKARAETVGEGPLVVLDGETYELAAELPMDAILVVAEELGNIGDEDHTPDPKIVLSALEGLFGDHWETLRPKLSVQDCMYVLTELLDLYGTDLPGTLGLGLLVGQHFEEVEADFARYYHGLDLAGAIWGPGPSISLRRFRALLRGIPSRDSALGAKLEFRQAGEWGNVEELLVLIAQVADYGNRLFFSAHAKKGTQHPKPLEVPRPERRGEKEAEKKRRPATSEELAAFFGGAVRLDPAPAEGTADADN